MDPAAPWLERTGRGRASRSKREPGSYVGVILGSEAKRGGVRSSSRPPACLCKSSSRKRGVIGLGTSLKGVGRLRARLVEGTVNPPPVRLTQAARADMWQEPTANTHDGRLFREGLSRSLRRIADDSARALTGDFPQKIFLTANLILLR